MPPRRQIDTKQVEQWSTEVQHHFWASFCIAMFLLAAALYVLLSQKYASDLENWAYGIGGAVLGYWLPRPIKR